MSVEEPQGTLSSRASNLRPALAYGCTLSGSGSGIVYKILLESATYKKKSLEGTVPLF